MEATTSPVPSWQVTRPMLRAWGLPVRDCPTGHGTVTTGPSFESALSEAWGRGLVVLRSAPDSERTWWSGPEAGARPAWLAALID